MQFQCPGNDFFLFGKGGVREPAAAACDILHRQIGQGCQNCGGSRRIADTHLADANDINTIL